MLKLRSKILRFLVRSMDGLQRIHKVHKIICVCVCLSAHTHIYFFYDQEFPSELKKCFKSKVVALSKRYGSENSLMISH
jgi:Ni,Fe-hydrogenase I cytochrome b subunit